MNYVIICCSVLSFESLVVTLCTANFKGLEIYFMLTENLSEKKQRNLLYTAFTV